MARDNENISLRLTFGTYACTILALDGTDYLDTKQDFANTMWNLHNDITNTTLLNEKPLIRWLTLFVIIIPQDVGQPKIHRLRIINTYASGYNLVIQFFWTKIITANAEKN